MLARRPTSLAAGAGLVLALLTSGTSPAMAADQAAPVDMDGTAAMGPDFDSDGYGDLAVGVPLETLGEHSDAGAVQVLYGASTGLGAAKTQLWSKESPGVPSDPAENENFGFATAWGDLNGDGFDDLAIGVPGQDIASIAAAGAVHVLYGSPAGLSASKIQVFTQLSGGVADDPGSVDSFGAALVVRDFDSDGKDDLVVGVPGEGTLSSGAIHVLRGTAAGLTGVGSQMFDQAKGTPENFDYFGHSLAAGDLNGDGHFDLAIGVPFEEIAGYEGAGAVNVLYGTDDGLSEAGNQYWTQKSTGFPVHYQATSYSLFGMSLAIAHLDEGPTGDLVIGAPSEDLDYDTKRDAGAIRVLYGTSNGLTKSGAQMWTQDSPGVDGAADYGDSFSLALTTGDFDKDGFFELAIGVPSDCLAGSCQQGQGLVNVLHGSAAGLSAAGDEVWSQDSPGVLDSAETGDEFGYALARGDFNGDRRTDLVVASPNEDVGSVVGTGMISVLYSRSAGLSAQGNQVWHQNSQGIPETAEDDDRFGRSLQSS